MSLKSLKQDNIIAKVDFRQTILATQWKIDLKMTKTNKRTTQEAVGVFLPTNDNDCNNRGGHKSGTDD